MHLKRSALLAAISAVGFWAAAPVVQGASWGPVTSKYDGKIRVEGSGNHYNDRGVNAANKMTIRDRMNDGNNVYGSTVFYFWVQNTSGQMVWGNQRVKSTGEVANTTITRTLYTSLNSTSEKSRAVSKACAQMSWPVPNSCGQAVTSWSY
jgi:hypothetical protein